MKFILLMIFGCLMALEANGALQEHVSAEDLHKRCLVELKYQFIPSNCFQWIKRSPLNGKKKEYLHDWFSTVCKKAVQKDESQVQFHVQNIALMSKECQKHLEDAFTQWSYKSKSEEPEKVMQLMFKSPHKSGRDLEYTSEYDLEKTKRYRNLRSARRRLN
jgi:hypothetical protein